MKLPVLKEGDKSDGRSCLCPAHLAYCDGCDCLRKVTSRWFVRRIDGYPCNFCGLHNEDEINL